MRALVYNGPCDVSVQNVPDAQIKAPTDVLVKITSTNICGSDLHMYEGRTSLEKGRIIGHENLGVVVEVGPAVQKVKVGDRVCLPFNIGCGYCANCEKGSAQLLPDHQSRQRRSALTVTPTLARSRADRPNIFRCLTAISTVWFCPKTRRTKKTIT